MYVAARTRLGWGHQTRAQGALAISALSSRPLQFENLVLVAHLLPKPGLTPRTEWTQAPLEMPPIVLSDVRGGPNMPWLGA